MVDAVSERFDLASRRQAFRARPDLAALLPVAAPVALLVGFLAVAAPALIVQDSWLTLVGGREVATHGLPGVDQLTVLSSGRPWVDQQWLAQAVYYGATSVGGLGAAVALQLLVVALAFGVAAFTAHRRGASPGLIMAFFVLAVAAAPWALQVRAQAFALPLFSAALWLLARDPDADRSSTLCVLPLLCLWANLHGSVVVGSSLVVLYGAQAAVRATNRFQRRRAAACVLLAPAAALASPYALDLPGYYRLMLLDPPFGRDVVEWHRTTPSGLTAVFFALTAITVVACLVRRSRLRPFELLVLVTTLAGALLAIRGIVWFALAALAIVPPLAGRKPRAAVLGGPVAAALAAAAVATILALPAWAATRPDRSYEGAFPARAAAIVRTHAQGRTVFADDHSADWLLWKLPALRGRVAYDVRFELLTRGQIARLLAVARLRPGWTSSVGGYGLVVADPEHVGELVRTGRWRRLYVSPKVAIAELR